MDLGGFVVFLGMPFCLSSFLGVVIIVNLVFLLFSGGCIFGMLICCFGCLELL